MAEMMAMMSMDASMVMPGPFDERESQFGTQMINLLAAGQSRSAVLDAYENSPLPHQVVEVLQRGRQFESRLYEILADPSVTDIRAALNDEVANYVATDWSVASETHAGRVAVGAFPRGRLRTRLSQAQRVVVGHTMGTARYDRSASVAGTRSSVFG